MNQPLVNYYKKNPVEIAAVQLTPNNEIAIVDWMNSAGLVASHDGTDIYIQTLEGLMRAEVGDFIIRGIKGEFYPCKPDIFEATYTINSGGVMSSETRQTAQKGG